MAYKFFNYAQAMKDKNEIASGRLKNQLQGMENEEAKTRLDNLAKARKIKEESENAPARIQALQDAGMHDEANKVIQAETERMQQGVSLAKDMREGLTSENWKSTRQRLIQIGAIEPEFMPTNYDDDWLRDREKEARTNLQKITVMSGTEAGGVTAEDRIYRNGILEETGAAYDPAKKTRAPGGGGGTDGITPAMSNSIGRTVAQRFDSIFDENTGEVLITDPAVRPKALGIRTLAEKYVLDGMTPAAAVEKASNEYGYQPAARTNDPGGIRNFLTPQQ